MEYHPREIEKKWKKYWEDHQTYQVSNESDKPKYYVLDMFPYPSGAGLHVGHPLGYIASDIFARYKRMKGFNVLHPMGYDAFGLPAEQYAIQTGVHPAQSTDENIKRYREQLGNLGFSFDWSREVKTCDPKYYKWTQWIFIQLFDHYYDRQADRALPIEQLVTTFEKEGNTQVKAHTTQETIFSAAEWQQMSKADQHRVLMNYRLAYREVGYVNWCEELGTVLANDQIKDGVSERGGFPVVQKAMTQWYLRTTAYAERLLNDLNTIDWSNALKLMQRNWIGRSEGASLFFEIENSTESIEIFTTRPDTIFGATYMVLAPEHDLVQQLTTEAQSADIEAYLNYVNARSEVDRMAEKKVTGAFTGAYAINPFNQERIPIWIGEYVLKDYGTGAIMAVPADDERDRKFAEKFDLKIIEVIDKSMYPGAGIEDKVGKMINSGFLDGMEVKAAIKAITEKIESMGIGEQQINYKLRDANFSRQRYWGEPFPVYYDADDIAYPVDEADLPLELPDTDDFKPGKAGQSPLSRLSDWVNFKEGARRETDTMPAVAGSSWYYLRYMDPQNDEAFAGAESIKYWESVDLYVGGTEHAVAHLLYARFWHKFLFDKGWVPTNEPFKKLINQGMIQGVIEFMFLQKDKVEGNSRFVCAQIKAQETDKEFVRIPVHIDFVVDYGTTNVHMNVESIEKFIEWRPDYKSAIFEDSKSIYQNGVLKAKGEEPVQSMKLMTHSEVGKMSKRYYNVVNPDDVIEKYGTDCFRMYEMFLGPIEQSKPWDTKGIDGVSKFLRRFWSLFFDKTEQFNISDAAPTKEEWKVLHSTIKKVNEDIERFSFNTCVSAFMVATNELKKLGTNKQAILQPLVIMLAPMAPHIAEELWQRLGNAPTVHDATFPVHDEAYLVEDSITYPISINGKKRALADLPADASKEDLEKAALAMEEVT
ncbi:MAG: leucine--tRNA ligase, partial [Bacteroidota bacterium]